MKILITVPKMESAIGRLARDIKKYNQHHEIRIVAVHPKRPDNAQLAAFEEGYDWCDIWDAEYWKTAEMLRERYGDRLKEKPAILSHYNPYDITSRPWTGYKANVVCNRTLQRVLPGSQLIPLAIDLNFFKYNEEYTESKTVLMVAQRIEASKGIEQVARVCNELGYTFLLVGEVSDQEYFMSVIKAGGHRLKFMERVPDDQLRQAYYDSAVLVCNSKDNFESGTMPILEAMACGTPVFTRSVGHVPDLDTGRNLEVFEGQPDDIEQLRDQLQALVEDRDKRLTMREEAWNTVRNYSSERRARQYSQLYNKTLFDNPLVSVIMPVYGHAERLQEMLDAYDAQTYPAIEIVIVSDGDASFDDMQYKSRHAVKYANVGKADDYGLGLARDYGVMLAEGEIVIFDDQRFKPKPAMVYEFVRHLKNRHWLYGNKDGNSKRSFVENVSCLYRQEYIEMGMGNQLIRGYGGMSQELRERSRRQGFKHVFVESAQAESMWSSHNKSERREEIRLMKDILWFLNLY